MKKSLWKKVSVVALILLLFFSISYGIKETTVALPENPITEEMQDSSKVALAGQLQDLLDEQEEDTNQEKQEDTEEQENETDEEEDKDETDENEGNSDDEQEEEIEDKEEPTEVEKKQKNKSTNAATSDKNENSESYKDADGDKIDDDSPNIDLNDGEKENGKKNEYFTTTINDGEVVTSSEYEFRIIHKENDYMVKQTEVLLNGKAIAEFAGKVVLEDEENTIGIKVTYEDQAKKTFIVTKSYTVHLMEDEIIITTDLKEGQVVNQPSLSFKAKAALNDESVPLTVKQNDDKLSAEGNNQYDVILQEGENKFTLLAESGGKKKEATYIITYEKKEAKVVIETDVKNETVSDPNYSFYAIAKADGNPIELITKVNDERLDGNGNGNYAVTLNEGENKLDFSATYEGKTVTEQYIVTYAKPDGGKEEDDVAQEIKIYVPDLDDGQTLKNSVHTFQAIAVDESGNELQNQGISIRAKNNGESIPVNWDNGSHVSFTFDVQDGVNSIDITAKDKDGNLGTKNITVQGDIAGEGEAIGHITLSLEATTIGLGHIIPATQVELYPNERASVTLDRVFEEYGISYSNSGSHDKGFYMEYIRKPGLYTTEPSIPEDLLEKLGDAVDINRYYPDELGEFDFTSSSGWMYSVNGTYPNVGFSDYYFKDGDTVRIRFTLAYGADIGGKSSGNFGKEW